MKLLIAVAVGLALLPTASAHEGHEDGWGDCISTTTAHLTHLCPQSGTVPAGTSLDVPISFTSDANLLAGWVLLVDYVVAGANLDATLVAPDNETVVAAWTWSQGTGLASVTFPETGHYVLRLSNLGADEATFQLVFDQSCECTAKWTSVAEAHVIFNWQLTQGAPFHVAFNVAAMDEDFQPTDVPADLAMNVWVATRTSEVPGVWPDDFAILQSFDAVGAFEVDIEPAETGVHYVVARVAQPAADTTLLLMPSSEAATPDREAEPGVSDSSNDAPGVPAWSFVAVLGLLGALARSKR